MKKIFVVAAMLSVAASSIAVAHADTGYKVTVNGQTVNEGNGNVQCTNRENPNNTPAKSIQITAGSMSSGGTQADVGQGDSPQYIDITIVKSPPAGWMGATNNGGGTVTKTGNTYKITGSAVPYANIMYKQSPGSPVPFEFDVTCP